MNVLRFYKAVADYDDDGYVDYDWLLRQIEEEDHPHYGPPIPMSMRTPIEQVLAEVYAPGLREMLNRTSPLMHR